MYVLVTQTRVKADGLLVIGLPPLALLISGDDLRKTPCIILPP